MFMCFIFNIVCMFVGSLKFTSVAWAAHCLIMFVVFFVVFFVVDL